MAAGVTDWGKIFWELSASCLGHDARFSVQNFAHQPTSLIFEALAEARRIEGERISQQSYAIAQFAVDYFQSKIEGESEIDIDRYLPFVERKKVSTVSDEVKTIIRKCLADGLIHPKFYSLVIQLIKG